MKVVVISKSPPGGRCRLYLRYAEAIASRHGWGQEVLFPSSSPSGAPAAPALVIGEQLVAPADGVIVSPDDIVRVLGELGANNVAEDVATLLRAIEEDFLNQV
jgi:hypothetical protein